MCGFEQRNTDIFLASSDFDEKRAPQTLKRRRKILSRGKKHRHGFAGCIFWKFEQRKANTDMTLPR
jgi:hypothetical protein